jgi:hypothetical protein
LTAYDHWQYRMNADIAGHEHVHHLGERATHPIEPSCTTLAVLQILAMPQGIARICALPARRITARSGAFNCRF